MEDPNEQIFNEINEAIVSLGEKGIVPQQETFEVPLAPVIPLQLVKSGYENKKE